VQEDSPLLAPPPEDVDDDDQDTGGDQGGDEGEAPTPKLGLGSSWSKMSASMGRVSHSSTFSAHPERCGLFCRWQQFKLLFYYCSVR